MKLAMENITGVVARNLQTLRKEMQMTLQELAEVTGVSKSMLGEIERGASNPTITVLWKISTGLKVSMSRLIHEPKPEYTVVRAGERDVLQQGPHDLSLIFDFDNTRNFEIYHIELQAGADERPSGHKNVEQYFLVYEGVFTIELTGECVVLEAGDSLRINADAQYRYSNIGDTVARAYSMIYYPFQ